MNNDTRVAQLLTQLNYVLDAASFLDNPKYDSDAEIEALREVFMSTEEFITDMTEQLNMEMS
jgi:hypothetical protein